MAKFGTRSKKNRDTCDERLIKILDEAIELYDFSVLCGYRTEEEQNRLYQQGRSKLRYPNSNHNTNPSKAVDIVPYPVDWDDTKRFTYLAGLIIAIGHKNGVKIRWGGNWNMNYTIIDDQDFDDLPHFEIVE